MIDIKPGHAGRLHEALGLKATGKIPLHKVMEALKSKSASVRKMANFARNARKWKR